MAVVPFPFSSIFACRTKAGSSRYHPDFDKPNTNTLVRTCISCARGGQIASGEHYVRGKTCKKLWRSHLQRSLWEFRNLWEALRETSFARTACLKDVGPKCGLSQGAMVQFSLKLEDNRVDKWSSHYLDYRKLKKAIKQLVTARNAADNIARRYD